MQQMATNEVLSTVSLYGRQIILQVNPIKWTFCQINVTTAVVNIRTDGYCDSLLIKLSQITEKKHSAVGIVKVILTEKTTGHRKRSRYRFL